MDLRQHTLPVVPYSRLLSSCTAATLVLMLTPSPAFAKSPSKAVVSGPGLTHPITLTSDEVPFLPQKPTSVIIDAVVWSALSPRMRYAGLARRSVVDDGRREAARRGFPWTRWPKEGAKGGRKMSYGGTLARTRPPLLSVS